jgi:signal transduction histidine kinase
LQYYREALSLAKKIDDNEDVLASLKLLTQNDTKNRKYYSNTYFRVADSIKIQEQKTRGKFARIAFETDQVIEKNEVLSTRMVYISLASAIAIGAVLSFFYIFRLRARNKQLLATEQQQLANEKIYELILQQQFETEQARIEERNRISMELHDGVVNRIFTTRFNLEQLQNNDPEKKKTLVAELQNTETEIRRISHDLNDSLGYDDNHLKEIIVNLVAAQQNESNTIFDLTIDKYIDWSAISGENKINIYRIIQEALQNVNKYAKAQKCFVMLLKSNDKTTLKIWDDGLGFDTKSTKKGIGLNNMKKRAQSMKGTFKIESKLGEGTSIEVVV